MRLNKDDPEDWYVSLDVWNRGRQDIKIDFYGLYLAKPMKSLPGLYYSLRLEWNGPEVPMILAAHSGDHWSGRPTVFAEGNRLLAAYNEYINSAITSPAQQSEFYLGVEIGGSRPLRVPVAISPRLSRR